MSTNNTILNSTERTGLASLVDPIEQFADAQSLNIGTQALLELKTKYAKGQAEHGGNFYEKPTVDNIREEVLDLIAYSHVLIEHRKDVLKRLDLLETQLRTEEVPLQELLCWISDTRHAVKSL